jgi:PilZ domain-containing protein
MRRRWSDSEIQALRRIGIRDRAGMASFRTQFPHISYGAITAKLFALRVRGEAVDAAPKPKRRL